VIGELAGRNEHRGEDDRVQAEDPREIGRLAEGGCDAWRGRRCPIVRKTAIAGRPKALQAEVALVGSFMIASFDAVLHGV
jgi:hypothetical protein